MILPPASASLRDLLPGGYGSRADHHVGAEAFHQPDDAGQRLGRIERHFDYAEPCLHQRRAYFLRPASRARRIGNQRPPLQPPQTILLSSSTRQSIALTAEDAEHAEERQEENVSTAFMERSTAQNIGNMDSATGCAASIPVCFSSFLFSSAFPASSAVSASLVAGHRFEQTRVVALESESVLVPFPYIKCPQW